MALRRRALLIWKKGDTVFLFSQLVFINPQRSARVIVIIFAVSVTSCGSNSYEHTAAEKLLI